MVVAVVVVALGVSIYWLRATSLGRPLYEKALVLLDEGKNEEAMAAGQKLISQSYSGGFEVVARVYRKEGKDKEAIEVLRKGVEVAPSVWGLWFDLQEVLSDTGAFDEALAALRRARECAGSPRDTLNYEETLIYVRQDDWAKALPMAEKTLASARSGEIYDRAAAIKIDALVRAEQVKQAVRFAEVAMGRKLKGSSPKSSANLYAFSAWAFLSDGQDPKAKGLAQMALASDRTNGTALRVLREIRGVRSPLGKRFKLLLEGREGQYTAVVVAKDIEAALGYARDMDPSVKLDKSQELEAAADELEGVESLAF